MIATSDQAKAAMLERPFLHAEMPVSSSAQGGSSRLRRRARDTTRDTTAPMAPTTHPPCQLAAPLHPVLQPPPFAGRARMAAENSERVMSARVTSARVTSARFTSARVTASFY